MAYGVIAGKTGGRTRQIRPYVYRALWCQSGEEWRQAASDQIILYRALWCQSGEEWRQAASDQTI